MSQATTRVLAILELLQAHGRMSGSELAQRLGVDGRTLRRYIVALEKLGVPITTERGRHGGYSLVGGFKLPPMMFTADEALALSLGLVAARSLGFSEATAAATSAQAKLERVMPANLKRRVRAANETVTVDLSRNPATVAYRALAVLTEAAQTQTRVHMRYRTPQGVESARDFDPYGLAYHRNRWYTVGMCHARGCVRSFRVDRVLAVHALGVSFDRPQGFDALGYLIASISSMPRAYSVELLLRTDLAAARRELFEAFGVLEPAAEGVLFQTRTDDLDWFARALVRLPFDFEIRRPEELRTALKACAERLLTLASRD